MADDDVIERVAEVLCDSAWGRKCWEIRAERFRDIYRTHARVLAKAGLLADGTAQARVDAALKLCDALVGSDERAWQSTVADWFRIELTSEEAE